MDERKGKIKLFFYVAAAYSFIGLPVFAHSTGGPCNEGVALLGVGVFLTITAFLTFFAIENLTKITGKILSILSLLIWGFLTIGTSIDDPLPGIIYFTPLFVTIIVTTVLSFTKSQNSLQ